MCLRFSDLDYKVGDNTAIFSVHPGPIGVEDPGNPDINPRPLVVGIGQGLCHPLTLVIAGTGANGVDIAPVGLRLRMHLRISIHLIQVESHDVEIQPDNLGHLL